MQVRALFDDMSDASSTASTAARGAIEARIEALPQGDALTAKLQALQQKLDEAKKKIVATKEGGAITGEERIREHLDQALRRVHVVGGPAGALPGRAHRRAARAS